MVHSSRNLDVLRVVSIETTEVIVYQSDRGYIALPSYACYGSDTEIFEGLGADNSLPQEYSRFAAALHFRCSLRLARCDGLVLNDTCNCRSRRLLALKFADISYLS
eukprot:gnl/TRDRNA2_/TRDRNA2_169116_c2_seq1.p1 gnl/TRDRNA2_/TRDRNA2_169116_c2~~gnl/TRDRNA2_/TRDRNA2_169116_c2_seq1.p1  ORF type:complete len:106 (+),score=2.24 gnl/TRDRNA2_/TRDRNA2_169116_c2_seq1:419-736(+)